MVHRSDHWWLKHDTFVAVIFESSVQGMRTRVLLLDFDTLGPCNAAMGQVWGIYSTMHPGQASFAAKSHEEHQDAPRQPRLVVKDSYPVRLGNDNNDSTTFRQDCTPPSASSVSPQHSAFVKLVTGKPTHLLTFLTNTWPRSQHNTNSSQVKALY
jgi:hypothetical protein